MATRFYLEADVASSPAGGGNPALTPAFDAAWGVTTNAVRRWLTTTKLSSPLTTTGALTETSSTAINRLAAQFISAPLATQTIDGTVTGQMQMLEGSADADCRTQMVVWVLKPDGTSRGTLLAADDASGLSSEFSTSNLTNRTLPLAATSPAALTTLSTVTAGDRLVVEIGARFHNATATQKQFQTRYGTNGASGDLPADETDTSGAKDPWIEFSDTITFEGTAAALTQQYVEAVAADSTTGVRVTQQYVEAVAADTTPGARVSQIYVEAVVERDYAGWGTLIADDPMLLD